jgi:Fe-S-cluster-containing dehydrogenase component
MAAITRRSALQVIAAAGAAAAVPATAEARVARVAKPDDAAMLFDATRCIGCRACVTRCREANHTAPDVVMVDGVPYDAPLDLNGSTLTIVKRWEDGARAGFFKAQCMHCADPACVSVCMMAALHKSERGVVAYDVSRCVGCRYCQVACPFNVPRFQWSSATPRIVKCEMCRHRFAEGKGPACAEVCPRGAIVAGSRAELLAEAKRRIAEQPESYHPAVFGEREAGGTGLLVLSPVPFDRIGLPAVPQEPLPTLVESVQHGIYQGFALPAGLYAALAFVAWRNHRSHAEEEDR